MHCLILRLINEFACPSDEISHDRALTQVSSEKEQHDCKLQSLLCVLIRVVYVPTGRGGWTRWCILKVTFTFDCRVCCWTPNVSALIYRGRRDCSKMSPPEKTKQTKKKKTNTFTKPVQPPNGDGSPFEFCQAIFSRMTVALRVTVVCQSPFRRFLDKKTFMWHFDWHRFLLKFKHTQDRHRRGDAIGCLAFFQVTPCKAMTSHPCWWGRVSQGYRSE